VVLVEVHEAHRRPDLVHGESYVTNTAAADNIYVMKHVLGLSGDHETSSAILTEIGQFASLELEPLGRAADAEGCRFEDGIVTLPSGFKEVFRGFADDGWLGLNLPEDYGGSGLSNVLQAAVSEIVNGAFIPLGMLAVTARGAAKTLLKHADPKLCAETVPRLCRGEWTSTIAMTEPGAGSDPNLMSTRASLVIDRRYLLNGNKVFISFAAHDLTEKIIHLVLAKVTERDDAISLFMLSSRPSQPDPLSGIEITGIEQKLGLHASPTCALAFHNAEGLLIGEVGGGLKCIFTMVNCMRLEVASEGVGVCHAATELARRYARERIQGGGRRGRPVPIIEHPDVRRMISEMACLTEGLRALTLQAAALMDIAERQDAPSRSPDLLALLLPICKFAASEFAVAIANLGIQVHGGSGYTRASRAEQYLRDARILPIYEGTSGMQAIDLVMRKVRRSTSGYHAFLNELNRQLQAQPCCDEAATVQRQLRAGVFAFERATNIMTAQDDENALAVANDYIMLSSIVAVGWMWFRMASVQGVDAATSQRKRILAKVYADKYLTSCEYLAQKISFGARSTPEAALLM